MVAIAPARPISRTSAAVASEFQRTNKTVDIPAAAGIIRIRFSATMLAPLSAPSSLTNSAAVVLQFPSGTAGAFRSLRNMTAQLLLEATKVIPNQQLLINVVSKRVRQLGLGHRPLVEATIKSSLTDIALHEIIAGKLTYEEVKETPAEA
jgi:DNA-directed RNA polymerase subunit omega